MKSTIRAKATHERSEYAELLQTGTGKARFSLQLTQIPVVQCDRTYVPFPFFVLRTEDGKMPRERKARFTGTRQPERARLNENVILPWMHSHTIFVKRPDYTWLYHDLPQILSL
ncbi:hypothetical protein KP509_29G027000 [Ceratopteris richardii]|uniref:Uncharacterized protein n=1 Tax=Ceratopteris richardii TaxID=49495 RepID=A0A8T2R5Q4_CERRI|nr:hypothetical protein KP509_38G058400 [Ceratopteris richardii]KAH7291659.1 hypothetical protein KP509_29G027000 [Ceratopteris richardii]